MEETGTGMTVKGHNKNGIIAILADGDYPTSAEALRVMDSASHIICRDRAGMEYISRTGKRPYAIVGDGDSMPDDFKKRYADIYHQVCEQDYNDLTKATRFAIKEFCDGVTPLTIAYLGATGKREDHTIGNISLMSFYMREFNIKPVLYTDYGVFTPCMGTQTLASFAGQQVSIFNLSCHSLNGEGLKWAPYPYAELWQGTLNEAIGSSFTINADGTFIVYQTYK